MKKRPKNKKMVYIIAGPNGSGKTTFAKEFVLGNKLLFLNADEIAMKLSPGDIRVARLPAGREFLRRIAMCTAQGKSFAVETTLAGKYWIHLLKTLEQKDYSSHIIFIFVESVEEALRRIDIRVRKGGHPVPVEDVRRRFNRSKANFWHMYRHLVDDWKVYLNSKDEFVQVAMGMGKRWEVIDENSFRLFREGMK